MIQVWYNPAKGNQVEALYTNCGTKSKVWKARNCLSIRLEGSVSKKVESMGRDCQLVLTGGAVADAISAINPVQPKVNAEEQQLLTTRASGRDKLIALGLTEAEIGALLGR